MIPAPDRDDTHLQTEYTALVSYSNQVVSFRFGVLSFFLIAIGFSLGHRTPSTGCLLVLLATGLWILELRNRALLATLAERGRTIEERWGENGLFSVQAHGRPRPPVPILTGGRLVLPLPVSHTLGLDIIYGGVIVWALVLLI